MLCHRWSNAQVPWQQQYSAVRACLVKKQQRSIGKARVGHTCNLSSENAFKSRPATGLPLKGPGSTAPGKKNGFNALISKVEHFAKTKYNMMTKPVKFHLPLSEHAITTTLSNLCGHGSFVMLALGYMESDVLLLRMYATNGIFLSILFQYYRPQPLWLPISWNTLFAVINLGMIGAILAERQDQELAPEAAALWAAAARAGAPPQGRAPFARLLRAADRRVLPPGTALARAGAPHRTLLAVASGRADARHGAFADRAVLPGQFVGGAAFLAYLAAEEGGAAAQEGEGGGGGGGGARAAAGAAAGGEELAGEDVVAAAGGGEGPVVVYAWGFADLRARLRRRPREARALQAALAVDLSRTLARERGAEERYRHLLEGTLMEGQVGPGARALLEHYRARHGVSEAQHARALRALGWGADEFGRGYRTLDPHAQEYFSVLQAHTKTGQISEQGKADIRKLRNLLQIDVEGHLMALSRIGWTLDEYEAGQRNIPESAQENQIDKHTIVRRRTTHSRRRRQRKLKRTATIRDNQILSNGAPAEEGKNRG